MQDNQIEDIIKVLKERYRFCKPEEIAAYLKPYHVKSRTVIRILEHLVEDDIFGWLNFIYFELPKVVFEREFVDLLKKIIKRIKTYLAQGQFIRILISIGEKHPILGFSLYKQMIEKGDVDLILYSGFPLGGAGKKRFNKAYRLIKEGLMADCPPIKVTCAKALRVIFENETVMKKGSEIFRILDKFSSEKEDISIQIEALDAYVAFSRFRPRDCTSHLVMFANRGDSRLRFRLAYNLWLRNLKNKKDEIKILRICAEDNDDVVLSQISLALSRKGQEFPEESLKIIKHWIIRDKYYGIHDIEYAIQEIGKKYLDRCIKEIERWTKNKNERLRFFIPKILATVSSGNYIKLVKSIEKWPKEDTVLRKIKITTLRETLTEIYPSTTCQSTLVDLIFSILTEMAEHRDINVKNTIQGEPDKFFQCFRLIEELETERKYLDYDVIFENLEKNKAIKDFFGEKWFQKMEKEKNRNHPLLILLSQMLSKEKVRPLAFLRYLEEMLKLVISKSKNIRNLKDGLRNAEQFWQTLSEIEVISSFINDYDVEIAPKIDEKKIDAKVKMDGTILLIEVINPDMFKPLRYLTGKALGIKNRIRNKIYGEFKTHLRELKIREDANVVILIDIGRSEISYDSIEDSLIGTQQLTMLIDKEKGEIVRTFPSRAKDYICSLEEGTNIISAVICYERYLGKDANFHREGKIILNPFAKNPLNSNMVEKLRELIFR